MAGFFNAAVYKADKVRGCASCGLSRGCLSPRMLATGENAARVLFVAEAPGEQEDKQGVQLVGEAGQLLRECLLRLGWNLDRDCRKINAVNCRPPGNRKPKTEEVDACRRFLHAELAANQPKVIIPMGTTALQSLYGNRYSRDLGGIMNWRGHTIPDAKLGAWVCPTIHPSYILRKGRDPAAMTVFMEDLRAAFSLLKTPHPIYCLEDMRNRVTVFQTAQETGDWLKSLLRHPPAITAFDYETTGLKPHRPGHKIICVSIATSPKESVAFPLSRVGSSWDWIRTGFTRYLASPHIRKATWNQQMEMRWSKAMFDVWPEQIVWDGQLASHVLDCRRRTTSLKFQVAVNFGILEYESTVERYKKSSAKERAVHGENGLNTMAGAPFNDVAVYGGLDSLFTLMLATRQRHQINAIAKEE